MISIERFRGALLGLAVGDALGTTLEFNSPGTFKPITDMVGGGPFNLKPGQWTDDTSMALCLADSLIACQGFNPVDQMERYDRWYRDGYLSSTGTCFDVGATVSSALHRFERTHEPLCGSSDPYSAGNGSIMRLAPVPMLYVQHPKLAIELSGDSSRTTHAAPTAVDACRYLGGLIVGALNGVSKQELLSAGYSPIPGYWDQNPLNKDIHAIAQGSFKQKQPPEIVGSGYVVRSLEAAIWAFYNTDTYRDGALLAVNLGNDADTTGAVYGQIAGAYYGASGIPNTWLERVAMRENIESLAEALYRLAQKITA